MYLEKSEEKFLVLYTLKEYEAPLDIAKLIEIMTWEKQVMEYFELSEILLELMEDKYIETKFYRDLESYSLTEKGEEALSLFKDKIPPAAKMRINDAVGKIRYENVVSLKDVSAEVLPSEGGVMLRCRVCEKGKVKMELSVDFGNATLPASLSAENFNKNGEKIYKEILRLCMPDED